MFKDEREVPDTFHLIAEYPKGHSVVLQLVMANSQHIPGLIRGHEGTLIMVEHGRFEGNAPYITLKPEKRVISAEYKAKFGDGADQDRGRGEGHDDAAHRQLPGLHAQRARSRRWTWRRPAARRCDHDGGAELPPGQGAVLRREASFKVVDKAPKA